MVMLGDALPLGLAVCEGLPNCEPDMLSEGVELIVRDCVGVGEPLRVAVLLGVTRWLRVDERVMDSDCDGLDDPLGLDVCEGDEETDAVVDGVSDAVSVELRERDCVGVGEPLRVAVLLRVAT